MDYVVPLFALLTGTLTGALFAYLEVPIPAPPSIAGVLGIVGIYLGFRLVEASGRSFDLLAALGFG